MIPQLYEPCIMLSFQRLINLNLLSKKLITNIVGPNSMVMISVTMNRFTYVFSRYNILQMYKLIIIKKIM